MCVAVASESTFEASAESSSEDVVRNGGVADDRLLRRSRRESADAIVWRFGSGLCELRSYCATCFRRLDGLRVSGYHGREYPSGGCKKAIAERLPMYVREELVPLRRLDMQEQIFSCDSAQRKGD